MEYQQYQIRKDCPNKLLYYSSKSFGYTLPLCTKANLVRENHRLERESFMQSNYTTTGWKHKFNGLGNKPNKQWQIHKKGRNNDSPENIFFLLAFNFAHPPTPNVKEVMNGC